jgi:hypothetical protein
LRATECRAAEIGPALRMPATSDDGAGAQQGPGSAGATARFSAHAPKLAGAQSLGLRIV